MRGETKKIIGFVACGILAAVIIGVLVWRLSTPAERTRAESEFGAAGQEETATSGVKATGSSEQTTEPESDKENKKARKDRKAAPKDQGAAANSTPRHSVLDEMGIGRSAKDREEADPLLPPHAVALGEQPADQGPGRVYRPTNITAAGPEAQGEPAPQPGGAATRPEQQPGPEVAPAPAPDSSSSTPSREEHSEVAPATPSQENGTERPTEESEEIGPAESLEWTIGTENGGITIVTPAHGTPEPAEPQPAAPSHNQLQKTTPAPGTGDTAAATPTPVSSNAGSTAETRTEQPTPAPQTGR